VLQEKLQVHGDVKIEYQIIKEEGPDHDKTFTAEVKCNQKVLAIGSGKTKKAAEMEAAKMALEKI
ncbi:MAG: putative dsRNA-binding protein, partial [Clostridia bacterium]